MTKSSKKGNSLQAVLDRQSSATPEPVSDNPAPQPETESYSTSKQSRSTQRSSREGKRLVAGHFPPAVAKQLKMLAAEEDKSVQALLEEALDLLFVKKGKGHIGHDI